MTNFFKDMDGDDKVMMVLILGITAMVTVYLVCAAITGNF